MRILSLGALRLRFLGCSALFLMGSASLALAQPPGSVKDEDGSYYVSGRLLVKAKPGLDENKFLNILEKFSAKRESKIKQIGVNVVKVPSGLEKKILKELSADPSVEFVELDKIVPPVSVPNDPLFSSQWHHTKIGSAPAWDTTQGDPNLIVAILDSGVDLDHPDLQSHLVPGWNFYNGNNDASDVYGHGTKVAGAAAAIGNNGVGVAGVASNVKIMPIRVTGTDGWATMSGLSNGLVWASDHGARIANMSFQVHDSPSVMYAAGYMRDKGGVAFNSAGNYNTDDGYPDAPTLITVSATGSSDIRASWSSFGASVDLAAPGVGIYTTVNGGTYGAPSGTSFSSPVAAGVGALVLSVNPALAFGDVEKILETSAVDLGDPGWDKYYGHGRVNAAAAVQMALTYTPSVKDTIAPSVAINSPASGSTVAGIAVVDITAGDNVGVKRVDLYVNGAFYATDTMAPYSFAWDTTSLGNVPSVTLTAKASDEAGNVTTSSGVSVKVQNVVDMTPPVVTISSPADGATVSGTVSISASASDNLGVSGLKLYIDGVQKASSSGSSLSYSWNTKNVTSGSHTIEVEALDSSSNAGRHTITVVKGGTTGGGGGKPRK